MDLEFFGKAMDAVGLKVVTLDDEAALERRIRPLHSTLKKCACGFIGTKHLFHKHMDTLLAASRSGGEDAKVFWTKHGEVLIHEGEEE